VLPVRQPRHAIDSLAPDRAVPGDFRQLHRVGDCLPLKPDLAGVLLHKHRRARALGYGYGDGYGDGSGHRRRQTWSRYPTVRAE
jgi:hypothetical protein